MVASQLNIITQYDRRQHVTAAEHKEECKVSGTDRGTRGHH